MTTMTNVLLMASQRTNIGDLKLRSKDFAAGGGGDNPGELTLRQWLARALIVNIVLFPTAIIIGGFVDKFPYTRELGMFYGITVVMPALILFADHLPQVLSLAIDLVRAYRGQDAK